MSTDLLKMIAKEKEVTRYILEYTFTNSVLGTQPKSAEVMRNWLIGKQKAEAKKKGEEFDEKLAKEIVNSHVDRMEEGMSAGEAKVESEEERAWTSFFHDEAGPYIGVYQIKASFRDMLSSLGITKAKRGLKQTYQHLMEVRACDEKGKSYSGVAGERVHFYRNGEVVVETDDFVEMTAHVSTAQGPRSVIKRHDAVFDATIRFVVSVPKELPSRTTAVINDQVMAKVLGHIGNNGIGCSRSQGYGVFDVTRFEKL